MTDPDLRLLKAKLHRATPEQRAVFIESLTPAGRLLVADALAIPTLEAHQQPPAGDWETWLLLAGRGAGKTFAAACAFNDHMMGPACDPHLPGGHRAAIVAPTQADAWEACVEGPSGLKRLNRGVTARSGKGGTHVYWPNGAEARLFGAYTPEEVERLRAGGNRCAAWCEELATWIRLQEAWEHLDLGLRQGAHPIRICSTTPKKKPLIKALLDDPHVAVTRAATDDNPHLHPSVRRKLYEKYGGTRLGQQELHGLLLEDVEGALFQSSILDADRVALTQVPTLDVLCVAVDPPGGLAAEAGIVTVGAAIVDGLVHYYALADDSERYTPDGWSTKAVEVRKLWSALTIVFERNCGWEMGPTLIAHVDPTERVTKVTAMRQGKRARAEPVAQLSEQHRLHIVDNLPGLEDQMTSWTDAPSDASPDRMDALVWGVSWCEENMARQPAVILSARGAQPGRPHILNGNGNGLPEELLRRKR